MFIVYKLRKKNKIQFSNSFDGAKEEHGQNTTKKYTNNDSSDIFICKTLHNAKQSLKDHKKLLLVS